MRKTLLPLVLTLVVVFASARSSEAGPLALNCPGGLQDLSSNASLNFGGSGIPKDAVCAATFSGVDLVLTAHQRFDNPEVTNNSLDTYYALAGADTAHGQPGYGLWNFGFYAHNGGNSDVFAQLAWEVDPAVEGDASDFGFTAFLLSPGATVQDSWNLGMGFIDSGMAIPGAYAPAFGSFNPLVAGQYNFSLGVFARSGAPLGSVDTNVEVESVPEPTSLSLLGLGGLGFAYRLRRRRVPAL